MNTYVVLFRGGLPKKLTDGLHLTALPNGPRMFQKTCGLETGLGRKAK
jgi:hypothetical protein